MLISGVNDDSIARTVNPFLVIRQSAGLSQIEFARAIGVSVTSVEQAEQGISAKPRSMYLALGKLDFDMDKLARDYTAWREAKNDIARQRFAALAPVGATLDKELEDAE